MHIYFVENLRWREEEEQDEERKREEKRRKEEVKRVKKWMAEPERGRERGGVRGGKTKGIRQEKTLLRR